MNAPFFSVVIPTYNRERRVAAALRSVLAQADGDFECFVVDDASTDKTAEVLAAVDDPRVIALLNKANRGQHACRNQAIRASKGKWICFLDSDDLFLPERLAELRKAIAAKPETGFWFTNAYVHRYERIIGRLFDPKRPIPEGKVPGYYAVGDEFLPYVTTTVCVRRTAFDETGFFREDLRILEDTELYARMFRGGLKVGVLREPLAVRFLHEGQITRDYRRDFHESMEALRSAGAPPETAARIRERVALEVASYLWKAPEPRQAREFLVEEFGTEARKFPLYWKTLIPSPLLKPAKALRTMAMRVIYHPAVTCAEFKRAEAIIRAYLGTPSK